MRILKLSEDNFLQSSKLYWTGATGRMCQFSVCVCVVYKLLSHFANNAESLPVRRVEAEALLQVKTGYFYFEYLGMPHLLWNVPWSLIRTQIK